MSTTVDFEALYRRHPDPWGYTHSAYERDKYAATLEACGPGPFDHALELGGSIGVFTFLLARRCRALSSIDSAPSAVAQARRRLADVTRAEVLLGQIPDDLPSGPFDLVVTSEILYYLSAGQLAATLTRLEPALAPGGRLVAAVHWLSPGPERPLTATEVHEALCRQSWLAPVGAHETADYRLDVLERA